MPEGDTIHRTAQALQRALGGRTVVRFDSVLPAVMRVHDEHPVTGREIAHVGAVGKHVVMRFSGALILRTHLRMHGAWHLYRPGERWQRAGDAMRVLVATVDAEAVAFDVPVVELVPAASDDALPALRRLGPDLLAPVPDIAEAVRRLAMRPQAMLGEALLDQTAVAGIGNVFKSEVLHVAGEHPFTRVGLLSPGRLRHLVVVASRLLAENARGDGTGRARGGRRTTGRLDPAARLWVYGRGGRPCRRCGTAISWQRQGPHARSTYWCPACQPASEPRQT
ncbi:MAG: DNA-formamidopyrimidine glycosylase family protein [Vicinamibacterales bacterium]